MTRKATARRVIVTQPPPPAEEIPTEIIADAIVADAIVAIAEAMRKIRQGRLNDKALELLIRGAAPHLARADIRCVLGALDSLETLYLKKKS